MRLGNSTLPIVNGSKSALMFKSYLSQGLSKPLAHAHAVQADQKVDLNQILAGSCGGSWQKFLCGDLGNPSTKL